MSHYWPVIGFGERQFCSAEAILTEDKKLKISSVICGTRLFVLKGDLDITVSTRSSCRQDTLLYIKWKSSLLWLSYKPLSFESIPSLTNIFLTDNSLMYSDSSSPIILIHTCICIYFTYIKWYKNYIHKHIIHTKLKFIFIHIFTYIYTIFWKNILWILWEYVNNWANDAQLYSTPSF